MSNCGASPTLTTDHTTAGYILWDIPEPEEMSVKHKTQPYGGWLNRRIQTGSADSHLCMKKWDGKKEEEGQREREREKHTEETKGRRKLKVPIEYGVLRMQDSGTTEKFLYIGPLGWEGYTRFRRGGWKMRLCG
ncbi:hypothetical protein ABZX51_003647 [Aspergillus tubingensis]